jgi:hypothetical protein
MYRTQALSPEFTSPKLSHRAACLSGRILVARTDQEVKRKSVEKSKIIDERVFIEAGTREAWTSDSQRCGLTK